VRTIHGESYLHSGRQWGRAAALRLSALILVCVSNAAVGTSYSEGIADHSLRDLLPTSVELHPWVLNADTIVMALEPENLPLVYGAASAYYRDRKVLSAVTATYEYGNVRARVTVALMPSDKDALALYVQQRQAVESVSATFPAAPESSPTAFCYTTNDGLSGADLHRRAYATVQFNAASRLTRSFMPALLLALAQNVPEIIPRFSLWINNQHLRIDTPMGNDDEILLPLRPIFDYLGYQSLWVDKKLEAVFFRVGKVHPTGTTSLPSKITLKIRQQEGMSDGRSFSMRVAPFTFNGVTYSTPDIFEKALGMKVLWDPENRRLDINH